MVLRRSPELLARADAAAHAIAQIPPRAALAREMRQVRRAEIFTSAALAGSTLSAVEVDALVDRGIAQGNHAFDDYVLVRGYADAARWIGDARAYLAGDPRPVLSVDELRQLHARAAAGSNVRGGAWRQANPTPNAGIVAPAAWLVARETTTLVDRFGRGPQADPVAIWIARFMGRFARLRPFEGANGRTGRLAANLMLRRLDFPPLVLERWDRRRFPAALAAAETNDPSSLAALIAAAIVRTCNRLSAVGETQGDPIEPLRDIAGADYTALAKAAQRGRLRTIVRGGRYYTTSNWIREYRSKRRSAPVPPTARPTS
jgi:Fic family protein